MTRFLTGLVNTYRASGADLPLGQPERAHGVAMEGYFWRITDVASGRVLIALIGVNQGPKGPWATIGVATSPGSDSPAGLVQAAIEGAWADRSGLAAGSGSVFLGDDERLRVRLPECTLDAEFSGLERWPHRLWGGSSASMIPAVLSYSLVENPIRRSQRFGLRSVSRLVAATSLPPLALTASLLVLVGQGYWSPQVRMFQQATLTNHAGEEAGCDRFTPLSPAKARGCTWNEDGSARPIYLVGDSNADHFSESAIGAGVTLDAPVVISTTSN